MTLQVVEARELVSATASAMTDLISALVGAGVSPERAVVIVAEAQTRIIAAISDLTSPDGDPAHRKPAPTKAPATTPTVPNSSASTPTMPTPAPMTPVPATPAPTPATPVPDTKRFSVPHWLGEWSGDVWSTVRALSDALGANERLVLIGYNIPGRDNGNYSAGGLKTNQAFWDWCAKIADAASKGALVVVEPDALGLSRDLTPKGQLDRREALLGGLRALGNNKFIARYLDASMWVPVDDMAKLFEPFLPYIEGFSINVSGYRSQEECYAYGDALAAKINKPYVIDSSRNGRGAPHGADIWCNQTDTLVGLTSRYLTDSKHPNAQASLWLKVPGESDGRKINGKENDGKPELAPSAGTMWPEFRDAITSGNWDAFHRLYVGA